MTPEIVNLYAELDHTRNQNSENRYIDPLDTWLSLDEIPAPNMGKRISYIDESFNRESWEWDDYEWTALNAEYGSTDFQKWFSNIEK